MIGSGRPIEVSSGASLGRWGVLVRHPEASWGIRNNAGGVRPLAALPPDVVGPDAWLDEDAGTLVVQARDGAELVTFSLVSDDVLEVVELRREPDHALRFLRFVSIDPHRLCCVYEAGVLALNDDGHLLWHTRHFNVGTEVTTVEGGTVWLKTLWAGQEDRYFGFDTDTGEVVNELP
jgi:hypothetical protein